MSYWLAKHKVYLVCRIATVLLLLHHNQLTATASTRPLLALLNDILHDRGYKSLGMQGYFRIQYGSHGSPQGLFLSFIRGSLFQLILKHVKYCMKEK